MHRRVTQKSIASALGLHPSTVCLALKNSPLIPRETRVKVANAARTMGYVRDPVLAALSAYARGSRGHRFHGTLAWLVSTSDGENWQERPEYVAYQHGAKIRARELGYILDTFDLHPHEDAPDRLLRLFRRRNIRGVLVCPQPKGGTEIRMSFENLSAVTFGYTLKSPILNSITANHYGAIREIHRRLRLAGYKRIAYAIPEVHDNRLFNAYSSGFHVEQKATLAKYRVPAFTYSMRSADSCSRFGVWLRTHKPDALITVHYNAPEFLKQLGICIPSKMGVALTSVVDGVRHFSGMNEDSEGIGRAAAEMLIAMVERGETGLPKNPQRVLYSGIWQDGTTLRQQS